MGPNSVNKLEALGLVVGPVLALVFFAIEPGGMFVQPADSTDPAATITSVASNPGIARVTALMVPLGLILMLYGLSGISRVMRPDTMAAAWSRLGILFMNVGAFGWILTSGLTYILTRTQLDSAQGLESAIPIYMVDSGMGMLSSMAVAAGFMAFNLGLSAIYPPGPLRITALAIAAVSVVCLIAVIIGNSIPDRTMITVSRICYFPWVAWSVVLGVRFLKGRSL